MWVIDASLTSQFSAVEELEVLEVAKGREDSDISWQGVTGRSMR